jgi:hypothetical protein
MVSLGNENQRRSFGEQFGSLKYLLKNSVTVVNRNREVMYPWVAMMIYSFVTATLFFCGVAAILGGAWVLSIPWLMLSTAMWFYRFFFHSYQKTRLSWLVYETLCGRQRTFMDSRKRTAQLKGSVRKIALLTMIMSYVGSRKSKKGGVLGFLFNLLMAGLVKVLDLAKHYLLPSVAVDGLGFREAADQMKDLKERVPETLVGLFGVDILGKIAAKIISPLYIVIGFIGLVLAWALGDIAPAIFTFEITDINVEGGGTIESVTFAWPIILGMLFLCKSISIVVAYAVAALKVSYFTVFYTQITHPDHFAPALRDDMESFLRLEDEVELDLEAV